MDDLLIVEADPQACGLAKSHLQQNGYEVTVVETYAAAREVLNKQHFAMVLAASELSDGTLQEFLSEGPLHPLLIALGEKEKTAE